MTKSKVAILKTSPRTVLEDYHQLMNLADYQDVVAKDADTALKINISWHYFFPGSSTTPWQLEGVIRAMEKDGYSDDLVHACHNRTVVIDAHLGERENKQVNVVEAHGLRNVHLYEGEEWIHIRDAVGDLADKFLVLNEVYPDGFYIPKRFIGENIIHLPTIKAHIFTTTTGAMKNAFGGLLNERRHWTHPVIHETLVDLLMIQKKIHRGVFAVMDGTFAGDGPGPRCMYPHVKNVLLASSDQVAIDAMAAKLMGFNPLDIKYIRLAHERGLGYGDPDEIGELFSTYLVDGIDGVTVSAIANGHLEGRVALRRFVALGHAERPEGDALIELHPVADDGGLRQRIRNGEIPSGDHILDRLRSATVPHPGPLVGELGRKAFGLGVGSPGRMSVQAVPLVGVLPGHIPGRDECVWVVCVHLATSGSLPGSGNAGRYLKVPVGVPIGEWRRW